MNLYACKTLSKAASYRINTQRMQLITEVGTFVNGGGNPSVDKLPHGIQYGTCIEETIRF